MEFSVLGPLEVRHHGAVVPIHGQLRRALLGILLLDAGRVTRISTLIDGMWPDEPPPSAVENIRTYVYELRSVFHRIGDDHRVLSHPSGYELDAAASEVDMGRFLAFAAAGRAALTKGDANTAVCELTQARGLWWDTPLSGIEFGARTQARLAELEERRRQVDIDLIEARLVLRDHAGLIPMLRQLVIEYPLDEGLWHRLIVVLYALGRAAEALDAYSDARRALVSALGLEPGPALRSAQWGVLNGQSWEALLPWIP